MTAPNCPMKQRATARLRQTVRTIGETVPTYNRYQLLDNASEGPLEENTSGSQQPLYSSVLKRNKRPRGRPQHEAEAPHQPEDDIDAQIEALSKELERLRRHKELVTARRQKTGATLPTSSGETSAQTTAPHQSQKAPQVVWTAILERLTEMTRLLEDCLHHV